MAKILISLPKGDISQELSGDVITIGRTPDNRIVINHHSVSAHHARLCLSNGNYRLKDLDSTNRTCVNGIPVTEAELTSSCFLRFGTIECVFKADASNSNDQLHSQLSELQRQMDNLMKARDQIHQQNEALKKERDLAKQAAEVAIEELCAVRKTGDAGERIAAPLQQSGEFSAKLVQAEKQIEQVSRERDALLESNKELQKRLESATAQIAELERQAAIPAVQKKATAFVKEAMDESVQDYEEEELAAVGQKAVAAGSSATRVLSGSSLMSSWLNRGGSKRKKTDESDDKPDNITAMPLQTEGQQNGTVTPVVSAPAPSPALRVIQPPTGLGGDSGITMASSGFKHKAAAAAAANATPQNPQIRPAWELLNGMRRSLHYFLRHQEELNVLSEMGQNAHEVTEMAQTEPLLPIAELAQAIESLVRDLHDNPKNINASTLRTVGQSIDFMATLLSEANLARIKDVSNAKVIAVDDDQGILDIIAATLEVSHLNITTSLHSAEGLTKLSEQDYDLVLLDVGLPEMNGMDICSRVRAMAHHQKTPIVFLTGEATVQNRVQSTLNGGNDLIGKPFSVLELSVKVLTWIFKGQLGLV